MRFFGSIFVSWTFLSAGIHAFNKGTPSILPTAFNLQPTHALLMGSSVTGFAMLIATIPRRFRLFLVRVFTYLVTAILILATLTFLVPLHLWSLGVKLKQLVDEKRCSLPALTSISSAGRSTTDTDTDTTLVEEGQPLSTDVKKDGNTSSAPGSTRLDPSVPAFVPSAAVSAAWAPGPRITAPSSASPTHSQNVVLNPAVSRFVPGAAKQPAKALTFRWIRGRCVIRISAPQAPTPLNPVAAPFVPHVPSTPTEEPKPQPQTQQLVLRSTAPSFWSPGGCAIRITAPAPSPSK
jgi:hypothetical protein